MRVNDVNEFAPVFVEKLYRVAVTEGKLYDRILRVEAIDGDCSPQYSQICYYEILTPNIPFLIDNDGEILPLDFVRLQCMPLPRPSLTLSWPPLPGLFPHHVPVLCGTGSTLAICPGAETGEILFPKVQLHATEEARTQHCMKA